jgi:hypothetical protein
MSGLSLASYFEIKELNHAYTINKENREQTVVEKGIFTRNPVAQMHNFEDVLGSNLLEGFELREDGRQV